MDRTKLPNESGVYYIKNGSKMYIGYARDIRSRMRNHVHELINNLHHSRKLQEDWNNYPDKFECGVLEITNDTERESYWTKLYGSHLNGYNTKIRNSHSNETKKLLSCRKMGSKFSESHKKNLSISHIGNRMSDETRKKMSETRLGRSQSNDHIDKRVRSKKRNQVLKTIKFYQDKGLPVPDFQIKLLSELTD